jgi:CelD/BcsL family acetyltransferase involved in cellulose biosynthesis
VSGPSSADGGSWNVSIVRGVDVKRCFDRRWDQLVAATPSATTFQTAGWYRTWIAHVADAERVAPLVVLVSRNGRVVLACALQHRLANVPVVEPLTAPWSDYHEAVGDGGDAGIAALATGLRQLAAGTPVVLDDVRPGGLLEKAARTVGAHFAASTRTRALPLDDPTAVDRALRDRDHARKQRVLQRAGTLRIVHNTDRRDAAAAMARLIALHREQWRSRRDVVAPFDGGVTDAFFAALPSELGAGSMVVSELLLDDRVIASYAGLRHGPWFGAYRTTFDVAVGKHSPGHVLVREMIRTLPALGVTTFDFMRGDYGYKSRYASVSLTNIRATLAASADERTDGALRPDSGELAGQCT